MKQQVAALLELKLTESLCNVMLTRICTPVAVHRLVVQCNSLGD